MGRAGLAAVITVAAAFLAACGAEEQTGGASPELDENLERIARESDVPVYWLGRSFEGLPLTHAEPPHPELARGPGRKRAPGVPRRPPTPGPGAFFVYGECNPEGTGENYHCTGPQLQVQHSPIASPSRYPKYFSCTRTTIRGVPAAQFSALEIYVGRSIVRISAPQAQARRAAAALRPLDGSAGPGDPLPPPAIDVETALDRCALDSLEEKLDELKGGAQIPLFWTGRRFEQLSLFRAEGDGSFARFMYGRCETPEVPGSCYPALTVEVIPVAERRPTDWHPAAAMKCDRFRVRGAEAAYLPSAAELTVFTASVAVVLRGADVRVLERAADALQPFGERASRAQLPPPSDELRDELHRICAVRRGGPG
jgi:hypothetical protein